MAIQSIVDALSVTLQLPVLLDDADLNPLAFSRQWDFDEVRSESILRRGASPRVREALFGQGIAEAEDVVHIGEDRALAMKSRVCMPVREGQDVVGYLWLFDPSGQLTDAELDPLRGAAREIAAQMATRATRRIADEADLVAALRSSDEEARAEAGAQVRDRDLLTDDRLALCLVAPREPARSFEAARSVALRLSVGQAIAASAPEGAAVIVSLADPVLRMLPPDEISNWMLEIIGIDAHVGQSSPIGLGTLHEASHQAVVALKVAKTRSTTVGAAAWSRLGADRLLAQLPEATSSDVPESLATLLKTDQVLSGTLEAFLECAGDVKATAEALSLHRSGVYYRLRRIEELTGLELDKGDDRLLAHMSVRILRPSSLH
jgi:hypothetical protein